MAALCWLLTSATTGRSIEDFLLRSILTWRDWNRKQILQVWGFQRLFCCLLTDARSNIFTHPMQLYLKVKNVTAQAVNSHHRIVFSAELAEEELSVTASPWLQDTVKGNRDSLGGRYSASSWAPLITFTSQKQLRSDYSSDQIAKAPTLQTAWLIVRLCATVQLSRDSFQKPGGDSRHPRGYFLSSSEWSEAAELYNFEISDTLSILRGDLFELHHSALSRHAVNVGRRWRAALGSETSLQFAPSSSC